MNIKCLKFVFVFLAVILFLGVDTYGARKKKVGQLSEPDYTKGEKLKLSPRIWSIGPTGAFGNIWYNDNYTEDARMIQITDVTKGSPAFGILKKGDVILGVGIKKFSSDPRKAVAKAITEAEKTENDGKLNLKIWRPEKGKKGEILKVTVQLPVMGSYSPTSPWKCEKTETIINNTCEAIVKRGLFKKNPKGQIIEKAGVNSCIDALGLLATGEKKYLPVIKPFVNVVCKTVLNKEELMKLKSWNLAYMNILMCEYYLITREKEVLPAIKACASRIIEGRSGVGTWGHSMRMPNQVFASGYGSMNQIGLTLTISLILTQKCGVQVKDLDKALKQSLDFFRYFAEKGGIPYGDHTPGAGGLAGNGKSGQAAVMFDLAGEKGPAEYFTRLTVASENQLEAGHTGHFFNGLWGPMGAARGGEQTGRSYCNDIQWFTETERRFNGEFVFQPGQTKTDQKKYRNWSTSGSRLLQFCLPRRKLYITGKGGGGFPAITGDRLKETADAGKTVKSLKKEGGKFTLNKLLELLGNWCPAVREAAAVEIGKRDENVVDKLIDMLGSSNRYEAYGACEALRYAGRNSEKAAEALAKKALESKDMTLRHFAVKALRIPRIKKGQEEQYKNALGEASRKAGPALLKLATIRNPDDPMNKLHFMIAETLFYGGSAQGYTGHYPKGKGLKNIDRDLLIKVVKSLLSNSNGRARGAVAGIYPELSEKELKQLWGDIYKATKYQAPSGVMFSTAVRGEGVNLMAEKGYKEGIPLAMDLFRQEGWGHHKRIPAACRALALYGQNIKPYLPEVKAYFDENISLNKRKIAAHPKSKFVKKLRNGISESEKKWEQIEEAASKPRELKSLAPYLAK